MTNPGPHSTPEYGATNSVLHELCDAVAAVDSATEACRKKQAAAVAAGKAHDQAIAALDAEQRKRDRLAAAADLLADDWRSWPWVKEAGFALKVPRRVPA